MEGVVPDCAVRLRVRLPENLQRLVLGRGGEREVTRVGKQLARFHQAVYLILKSFLFTFFPDWRERLRHSRAGSTPLARMGFVDDDGEVTFTLLVSDLIKDERELLHRRDDDFLFGIDEPAQVVRAIGMPHYRSDLGRIA